MRYICLIYVEERRLDATSTAEIAAITGEMQAYVNRLREEGRCLDCSPLQSAASAATVRRRDGKTVVTDGPFAETKEQLLGFVLIEAADIAEAVAIASENPTARIGSVEVRPVAKDGPAAMGQAGRSAA